MQPFFEEPLEQHLTRVEQYMRGCELLRFPREKSPLRTELAAFIQTHAFDIINEWITPVAPVFPISAERVPETIQNMYDSLLRWARHIETPDDIETYTCLHEHARHGFISHWPPSRFLAGQMRVRILIVERLRAAYAQDRKKLVELLTLLDQEFHERLLHITSPLLTTNLVPISLIQYPLPNANRTRWLRPYPCGRSNAKSDQSAHARW